MFVAYEGNNNFTVGTEIHEPSEFQYLVFILGICNIEENEDELESKVDAEFIKSILGNLSVEEICSQLESITKRSDSNSSIYEWYAYAIEEDNKKVARQIVVDAEYHDGIATFKYNHSLKDGLIELKDYYRKHLAAESSSDGEYHFRII